MLGGDIFCWNLENYFCFVKRSDKECEAIYGRFDTYEICMDMVAEMKKDPNNYTNLEIPTPGYAPEDVGLNITSMMINPRNTSKHIDVESMSNFTVEGANYDMEY